MFDSISPNNSHHAYLLEGDSETARDGLFKMLADSWGIVLKGNPDFIDQKFESLGIDDARRIKELQSNKAFGDGRKIFVIEADSITEQAQNSLLKMFEEPTADTYFFLLGRCVKNLIPTLVSRFFRVRESVPPRGLGGTREFQTQAKDFLAATRARRLAIVKKLSDDIKDEKKTKAEAIALLNEVELILYEKTKKTGRPPDKFFEDLEMCRDYLADRSASVKMLLEYVALVIP